jgi:CDP-diacylglycerol--inositol 3-phosphatidyltransferase
LAGLSQFVKRTGIHNSPSDNTMTKVSEASQVYYFIPNLIGYSRIILLLFSLLVMPNYPLIAITSYTISCFLDAFDGYAARYFNQCNILV